MDAVESLISVSTEPVDISGATETLSRRVRIVGLPEGVQVVEPAGGAVDVVVQIKQEGVRQPLPSQEVMVVGLGPGIAAIVSPEEVDVTVVASEEDLAALTADGVSIQVNVTGLREGTYELAPIVALPPNVTWVSSNPSRVRVTIVATPDSPGAGTPAPAAEAAT